MLLLVLALAPYCFAACFSTLGPFVFQDTFPTTGNLQGTNGWIGNPAIQVAGGAANVVMSGSVAVVRNDVFATETSTMRTAFQFSVTAIGTIAGGTYSSFFHLRGTTVSGFLARVNIVPPSGGGNFELGISLNTGTAQATTALNLMFGTEYIAIVDFDSSAGGSFLTLEILDNTCTSLGLINANNPGPTNLVNEINFRQAPTSSMETISISQIAVVDPIMTLPSE
jgi:hypothetical protein